MIKEEEEEEEKKGMNKIKEFLWTLNLFIK